MGQRLSSAAVCGTKSAVHLATPEQELLAAGDIAGLIALKRSIFGGATMKEDDGDGESDDDDDTEDGDGDDDEDDPDDDDDSEDDSDEVAKLKDRVRDLSAESKRYRQKAVARRKRVLELEAENAKLKKAKPAPKESDKDKKDEDTKSDSDESAELAEARQKNEKLEERLVAQQLRTEFNDLTTGDKAVAQFKNPKAAFRLLDLDDVEIDDDGTIDGLQDAIKQLAEDEPYLLKEDKDSDDDEDDEADQPRRRRTGQAPRRRKKSGSSPDSNKLVNKYPALGR